jgi:hypothetical protein
MKDAEIDAYVFLAFDQPEEGNYSKADGSHFMRLRIPVLWGAETPRTKQLLGYLPLPT